MGVEGVGPKRIPKVSTTVSYGDDCYEERLSNLLLPKLIFSVWEILRFSVPKNFVTGEFWKKDLDLEYSCLKCGVICQCIALIHV